jgi:hypothetical protein
MQLGPNARDRTPNLVPKPQTRRLDRTPDHNPDNARHPEPELSSVEEVEYLPLGRRCSNLLETPHNISQSVQLGPNTRDQTMRDIPNLKPSEVEEVEGVEDSRRWAELSQPTGHTP